MNKSIPSINKRPKFRIKLGDEDLSSIRERYKKIHQQSGTDIELMIWVLNWLGFSLAAINIDSK